MKQTTFSDAEFTNKKKQTRRDRFLAEIEAVTPWPALVAALLPYYPKGEVRWTRPAAGRPGADAAHVYRTAMFWPVG